MPLPSRPTPQPRFHGRRWLLVGLCCLGLNARADPPIAVRDDPARWRERFAQEVDNRLDLPPADQQRYINLLQQKLQAGQVMDGAAQAVVLVDRSPQVQAAMIVLRDPAGVWHWLGATAVSTGKPGSYEHFLTPLGVFAHTLENPDFRAEGTYNKNHIRGYGVRGMRVYDFGWQLGERGWGEGGSSQMRFQMHATEPRGLEQRLGNIASEGCVRIPATLNRFLDRHGVLDADYERALAAGDKLWVLGADLEPMPWPGRYLVIVDSQATERPAWSPAPGSRAAPPPAKGQSPGGPA